MGFCSLGELRLATHRKQCVLNEQQLSELRKIKAFAELESLTVAARVGTEQSRLENAGSVMVRS